MMDISEELKKLNKGLEKNWVVDDQGFLVKGFTFKSFLLAVRFMAETAEFCEIINHHPNWSNVYRLVKVRLKTHDKNCLTGLDFKLASKMEEVYRDIND